MLVRVSLQLSLTVDHPQKVLIMGEAMDFGTCKAKKKNGDSCTQLVNLVSLHVQTSSFLKYFTISHFITPVCFNSMNASTASTMLKPSTRKWAQRGRSFSPASQAPPPVKERGGAVWRSACANLTSTTGACRHSPVRPRREFTASFYDLSKSTQTLKLSYESFILTVLPHSQRNNPLCSLF